MRVTVACRSLAGDSLAAGAPGSCHDDADELLSDGTNSYSNDQNGNLVGAVSSVFSWNYANRLAPAKVGSATASHSYVGDAARTRTTVTDTATPYRCPRRRQRDGAGRFAERRHPPYSWR